MKERVKELAERIETCKFNLGKYWVKNVPTYQLVFLTNGKGDDYDKLQISIENRNLLFPRKEWFMWNLWSYLKKRKKLGGMEWKRDT